MRTSACARLWPRPARQRSSHRGKPARRRAFDTDLYQARHLIENFFAKLKQFRAIATRYDKTARCFRAGIHLGRVCKG
jgi:transposase